MTLALPFPVPVTFDEVYEDLTAISLAWPVPTKTSLTLVNGWAAQAGWAAPRAVRYGNMVTVNAVLNGLAATNAQATTMPAGYRPVTAGVGGPLNYWNGAARVLGTVQITTAGVVNVFGNADALVANSDYIVALTFSVLA
jgi:hypothetical protein